MSTLFAHDLRLARRKAGLSQADVALLLETNTKELSQLEAGKKLPSLPQIIKLSLIYNRSFTSLYGTIKSIAQRELFQMLPGLPEPKGGSLTKFNREHTLKRLEKRLVDDLTKRDGKA